MSKTFFLLIFLLSSPYAFSAADGNAHWGDCELDGIKIPSSANTGSDRKTRRVLKDSCACIGGQMGAMASTRTYSRSQQPQCDDELTQRQIGMLIGKLLKMKEGEKNLNKVVANLAKAPKGLEVISRLMSKFALKNCSQKKPVTTYRRDSRKSGNPK